MCGRFVVSYTYQELLEYLKNDFSISSFNETIVQNYNVSPTEEVVSVIYHEQHYKAGKIVFGGNKHSHFQINSRSETILKNIQKDVQYKKCIIPASGFYEWDKHKTPYYFYQDDLMYFAGLYHKNGNEFFITIITKQATSEISDIHSRVPVILTSRQAKMYLSNIDGFNQIHESNQTPLKRHQVSTKVNNPSSKHQDNIKEYVETRLF
jgi:putative SOS response-associated peptidase YedK